MSKSSSVKCLSQYVRDGELLYIDDIVLRTLYTPGHTNESYSFIHESSNPMYLHHLYLARSETLQSNKTLP